MLMQSDIAYGRCKHLALVWNQFTLLATGGRSAQLRMPYDSLSVADHLDALRLILENLPDSLQDVEKSDQFPFIGFVPDPIEVEEYGSIPSAINHALEISLGWKSRSTGDGIIPINERGKGVCSLVDVLKLWASNCPSPDSDGVLLKWITDIRAGAEKAYTLAKKPLPSNQQDVLVKRPAATLDGFFKNSGTINERARTATVKRKRSHSRSDSEDDDSELQDRSATVRRQDLVDVPWSPLKKKTRGRPRKQENTELIIKCEHASTGDSYYRCIGDGCSWVRAGHPQLNRILRHAAGCRHLSAKLRAKANDWAAQRSLGAKAGVLTTAKMAMDSEDGTTGVQVAVEGSSGSHMSSPALSIFKMDAAQKAESTSLSRSKPKVVPGGLEARAVAVGREELRQKLDFHIMKLICVRGLVPTTLDTLEWKDFVNATNPRYQPTSATTFVEKHIPAEAAQVRKLQVELLRTLDNLTLTYDGATTRKPQSVYTVHITTQDRRVFFMGGDEASKEHHTAEYVMNVVYEVMLKVGIERFSGICSDNTGNTRKARELLVRKIPTMLNLLDCCHHLHNTAKDVTKLSEFQGFVSNLRKIIKYFKKSTIAATELSLSRVEEGGLRTLQSIGKTRFATVFWSAESLRNCFPTIRRLVATGRLNLKGTGFDPALLQDRSSVSIKFELELRCYTSILSPIAHAIKALEATDATAADVFVFWHAIAASLQSLFARPEEETDISPSLAKKVQGVINRRMKEVIDNAPADIYFTAFFLHPKYARADILARPTSMSAAIFIPPRRPSGADMGATTKQKDDSEDAPIPRAYFRVKEFLKSLLQSEFGRTTIHPTLQALGMAKSVAEFRRQLMAYARAEWPFDRPLSTDTGRPVLQWWLDLAVHPDARVLAILAIKLYSIAVNSMADERTASNFSWFNSALRNRQEVQTLVDMIQVRQWYLQQERLKRAPKTEPTVRWADITEKLLKSRESCNEDLDDDTFFEDWPSEPVSDSDAMARHLEEQHLMLAESFDADAQTTLASVTLRTLLCEPEEQEESDDDQLDEFLSGVRSTWTSGTAASTEQAVNWDF
ncbi:ribonuclease H-like domain-containing protein [Trametes meyenii]|nr:ribonuclease H-like domain-containing protein [Trametes meyenii]